MKTTFHVSGMHCPSCKMLVEDICQDADGIRSCIADYTTGKIIIEHDEEFDKDTITKEIESIEIHKVTW